MSYIPNGFTCSYIVPIPKTMTCRPKAVTVHAFRDIARRRRKWQTWNRQTWKWQTISKEKSIY